jgi:hypothetical protein
MSEPAQRDEPPPETRRALARRLALIALAMLPLAACGRRGKPEAPADADPAFPRIYPTR